MDASIISLNSSLLICAIVVVMSFTSRDQRRFRSQISVPSQWITSLSCPR
jgi:hypothetical protein